MTEQIPECLGGGGHNWLRSWQPCDRTFCGAHLTLVCEECPLAYDETEDAKLYGEALRRIAAGTDSITD